MPTSPHNHNLTIESAANHLQEELRKPQTHDWLRGARITTPVNGVLGNHILVAGLILPSSLSGRQAKELIAHVHAALYSGFQREYQRNPVDLVDGHPRVKSDRWLPFRVELITPASGPRHLRIFLNPSSRSPERPPEFTGGTRR